MTSALWVTHPLTALFHPDLENKTCARLACNTAIVKGVLGGLVCVCVCVFSVKSIDLELALIDHIPFPFSVTPPPSHPPSFLHHNCTHTPLPSCPGHLSDSARELSVPAGVRATERPLCPRRPYSGISVPLRAVVARAHKHTHTHALQWTKH